jgi:hypothetical protein
VVAVAVVVILAQVKELVEVELEVIELLVTVQAHYKIVQYFYPLEITQLQLEQVEQVEQVLALVLQILVL